MIQIWKSDTPAQRILEWVCWFCRGDRQLRDQEGRAMDIVVRLRVNYLEFDSSADAHMALEAADEIERLRAELAAERERCTQLRAALGRLRDWASESDYWRPDTPLARTVSEALSATIREGE